MSTIGDRLKTWGGARGATADLAEGTRVFLERRRPRLR